MSTSVRPSDVFLTGSPRQNNQALAPSEFRQACAVRAQFQNALLMVYASVGCVGRTPRALFQRA
eukprot:5715877-Alexandrium_andersonii.AAC.1